MRANIIERLLTLNRQFYKEFGGSFSSTRRRLQPGVKRVADLLTGNERILDLGCGNGEFARLLQMRGHAGVYIGLDYSPTLLQAAKDLKGNFSFMETDLSKDWADRLKGATTQQFDIVTAFAVLHHLPSLELRTGVVKRVSSLLSEGGRFILANWQFLNSQRLRARIQSWERVGLSSNDVETNDYLLDWRRDGEGLRYVHHFSEEELKSLAASCGFEVCESFYSDGENGRLGLYQIWEVL